MNKRANGLLIGAVILAVVSGCSQAPQTSPPSVPEVGQSSTSASAPAAEPAHVPSEDLAPDYSFAGSMVMQKYMMAGKSDEDFRRWTLTEVHSEIEGSTLVIRYRAYSRWKDDWHRIDEVMSDTGELVAKATPFLFRHYPDVDQVAYHVDWGVYEEAQLLQPTDDAITVVISRTSSKKLNKKLQLRSEDRYSAGWVSVFSAADSYEIHPKLWRQIVALAEDKSAYPNSRKR